MRTEDAHDEPRQTCNYPVHPNDWRFMDGTFPQTPEF